MGSTDCTCIAWPPGGLKELQTLSLRLEPHFREAAPKEALGDVPSGVVTEAGRPLGWKDSEESERSVPLAQMQAA